MNVAPNPRTLEDIDRDINVIKAENPRWFVETADKTLITALINEKLSMQPIPAGERWPPSCWFVRESVQDCWPSCGDLNLFSHEILLHVDASDFPTLPTSCLCFHTWSLWPPEYFLPSLWGIPYNIGEFLTFVPHNFSDFNNYESPETAEECTQYVIFQTKINYIMIQKLIFSVFGVTCDIKYSATKKSQQETVLLCQSSNCIQLSCALQKPPVIVEKKQLGARKFM